MFIGRIDMELVLERAAIMEFDGGLPQHEAERLAESTLFGLADPLVQSWLDCHWH
jgi:hypothetical protein